MKMPDGKVMIYHGDGLIVDVEIKELVKCTNCRYRYDPVFCPMHQKVFIPNADEDCDLPLDDAGWLGLVLDDTEDDGFCHIGKRKEE